MASDFGRLLSRRGNLPSDFSSRHIIEALEARRLLSANVLTNHNDTTSSGVNSDEVALTPTDVTSASFGKLYATDLDGQVYAQPLVDTGVTIGGSVVDAVFVATENDSLYAINSATGQILWQRSFLTLSDSNGILNNTLGASSISTVSPDDVGSTNISPSIGITSTPVIDSTTNLIYLVTKTKEVVDGTTYFVQRIHAINISDGTDAAAPFLIGTTTGTNTNNTPIYVYGTGDGAVTDPYNNTGEQVVQFNALTENQRVSLSLVNNTVYVSWASHGDNGPYHGWVVAWDVSNITTSGFQLSGVLNTCPNDGESGIWQGGGGLVFEPDGSAFYFLTGNGTGEAPTDGINGLPIDADYNEALVKAEPDPTTTPTDQNPNGWGLKIVSSFTPYNVAALDGADSDFGSGAPILIPNPVDINGVETNLIIAGGKDGRIFVLNRDNLGGYNATTDAALNDVPNGSGDETAPVLDSGTLNVPAYYDGHLYVVPGYGGSAEEFSITSTGALQLVSQTAVQMGFEPGSPSISSDGTNNGIVWVEDRNTNELRAYSAISLNYELWNSAQAPGGADNPGQLVKFANPTIANGQVFVGTSDQLVVYGLTPSANSASNPPVIAAVALSSSAVNLTWTDSSVAPNIAISYLIEESTDGVNFTQVASAPAGATSIGVGGLNSATTYFFRIQGYNSFGDSDYSNVAYATTESQSGGIDYTGGFSSSGTSLSVNGNATINGNNLEITDGGVDEAGSGFTNTAVDVTSFTSQFTFQLSAGPNTADGFTFTLQDNAPTALGYGGGNLGYDGIGNSVAIKFGLSDTNGQGPDSTGFCVDGESPITIANPIDLRPSGVDLHSGDPIQVNLSYNGVVLSVNEFDTVTQATASQSYTVDIPGLIGGNTAYAGFTGGSGGAGCVQDIQSWSFNPGGGATPNAPTGLGATPTTATSVTLNWTNNALNDTGFYLDRATNPDFTQNLVTETIPADSTSYVDTAAGLATGSTYYYRIRAFNLVGSSGDSNVASVAIPQSPPKATNQVITGVSSNEIDMAWQDNAGHQAIGYEILRATNLGSFSVVANLPPTSRTAPSTYTWADTTVTPGNYYEYHIVAYNSSGYNDFAGLNATTLTLAPTGITAAQGDSGTTLSWSAVSAYGAVTYNIYRSTTLGGEGSTPLYTGITGTSFLDTTTTPGTTYYYRLTAVNGNAAYTPPLPSESALSVEIYTSGSGSGVINTTPTLIIAPSATLSASGITATLAVAAAEAGDPALTYTWSTVSLPDGDSTPPTFSTANGTTAGNSTIATFYSVGTYQLQVTITDPTHQSLVVPLTVVVNPVLTSITVNPQVVPVSVQVGGTIQFSASGNDQFDNTLDTQPSFTWSLTSGSAGSIDPATGVYTASGTVGDTALVVATATGSLGSVVGSAAVLTIPQPPPKATNPVITGVSTNEIDMTWQDNAGSSALGYHIVRSTNDAGFVLVANLPPASATAPSTYTWADTTVTPGNYYQYRVEAYNSTGYSGYAGLNVTTITLAPTGVVTADGPTGNIVSWAPVNVSGAVTYNIYRSTIPGGQGSTPLYTGITGTSIIDTTASSGTTYYYYVTAVNANSTLASPLPSESATSAVGTSLSVNGNATINASGIQVTDGGLGETGSAFTNTAVDVTNFTSQFTLQLTAGDRTADGLTFTLQNNSPTAVGIGGSGLGYAGIGNSVAIKFDIFSNNGEGPDSTGFYSAGAMPTNLNSIDLSSTGIDLHSGDPIQVSLVYNGTVLTVTELDTVSLATASQSYTVNIPSLIGSNTAYAGFTGGTGGIGCVQDIQNWTYNPGAGAAPNAPSNLGANFNSATSITLNWTNNAPSAAGFYLQRATDPNFTQNLVIQTIAAGSTSFVDTASGLVAGGTYYYRIAAYDSAGTSGESNIANVTITLPPAQGTNAIITGVSTSEIDMTWQDNAGNSATGYNILRATNDGGFVLVATLPAASATAPSTYTWADTSITPGNYYQYRIEAYNDFGYSGYASLSANAITLAPTGVTAAPGTGGTVVSWSAVSAFGTVTYDLYRSTTPGGEGSTPVYTSITGNSFLDQSATPGTTYYYEVTAVNANSAYSPPLPSESALSAEVARATPVVVTAPSAAFDPSGINATLSVAAAEVGNPALTYTWSVVSLPAGISTAPTFSTANGTTAGNSTIATFSALGTYQLEVTITDPADQSLVVPLTVVVTPVLTSITITPAASPVSVLAGGTIDFAATGDDQFGNTLATQPTITWSLAGGSAGFIDPATGVYTASDTLGSTATVTASATGSMGTVSGSASVAAAAPSWLASDSVGTWNPSTSVLTVTEPTTIIADPGTDEPIIEADGANAIVTLDPISGIGTDFHIGGLSLTDGASLTVDSLGASRSLTDVNLLVIGTPTATAAPMFNIDSTSTLDLADNDMAILDGAGTGTLPQVQEDLQTGYNNGAWNDPGLISSVAPTTAGATGLGYATGAELIADGESTFDGLSLASNAVLVKYTLAGDTTLSGTVSGADYNTVLSNFDGSGDWSQGNFHYGGIYASDAFANDAVGGQDYNSVLNNFDVSLAAYLPGGADAPSIAAPSIAAPPIPTQAVNTPAVNSTQVTSAPALHAVATPSATASDSNLTPAVTHALSSSAGTGTQASSFTTATPKRSTTAASPKPLTASGSAITTSNSLKPTTPNNGKTKIDLALSFPIHSKLGKTHKQKKH